MSIVGEMSGSVQLAAAAATCWLTEMVRSEVEISTVILLCKEVRIVRILFDFSSPPDGKNL